MLFGEAGWLSGAAPLRCGRGAVPVRLARRRCGRPARPDCGVTIRTAGLIADTAECIRLFLCLHVLLSRVIMPFSPLSPPLSLFSSPHLLPSSSDDPTPRVLSKTLSYCVQMKGILNNDANLNDDDGENDIIFAACCFATPAARIGARADTFVGSVRKNV